jgi:hypothetical protein
VSRRRVPSPRTAADLFAGYVSEELALKQAYYEDDYPLNYLEAEGFQSIEVFLKIGSSDGLP